MHHIKKNEFTQFSETSTAEEYLLVLANEDIKDKINDVETAFNGWSFDKINNQTVPLITKTTYRRLRPSLKAENSSKPCHQIQSKSQLKLKLVQYLENPKDTSADKHSRKCKSVKKSTNNEAILFNFINCQRPVGFKTKNIFLKPFYSKMHAKKTEISSKSNSFQQKMIATTNNFRSKVHKNISESKCYVQLPINLEQVKMNERLNFYLKKLKKTI